MNVHTDQQQAISAKLHHLHDKAGEIRRRLSSVSRRLRFDPPASAAGVILNIDIAEGETRQLLRRSTCSAPCSATTITEIEGGRYDRLSRGYRPHCRRGQATQPARRDDRIVAGMADDIRRHSSPSSGERQPWRWLSQAAKAFECPRKAAAAHEAGHAINYAANGSHVRSEDFHRSHDGRRHWLGLTLGGSEWRIAPDTAPDDDLIVARNQVAGVLGEFILIRRISGRSSLDEVVLAQSIVAGAAAKLGIAFEPLMASQIGIVRATLAANRSVLARLAETLHRRCRLRGAALTRLLADVEARGKEALP